MKREECSLFSGGAQGAEAEFGAAAEKSGIEEVNFTFEGHKMARTRGIRMLNHEELKKGDVSLAYVSGILKRQYPNAPVIRKVLQTIWYQVNSGQEVYVIGRAKGEALDEEVILCTTARAELDQELVDP